MANQQIVITITQNGGQTVIKNIQGIGDESKKSGSAVSALKSALATLGTAATIKGFVDMLNQLGDARNRLGFVSKGTDEVTYSMQKLFEISNNTRTSFGTTLDLYTRIAIATDQLGVSHADAARLVQTLNEAVILSGVSGRQASNAMLYLAEGLAAGTLRGRELRSLMMQFPVIADVLAQKLGVTRGALREMGTQGQISSQLMVQALLAASGQIDAKFAGTNATIGQSFTVLKNHVLQFVGDLDQKFGIITKVTKIVDIFGEHMDLLGKVVLAGSLTAGAAAAAAAIYFLNAAILANPITSTVLALTAAVVLLLEFSDQINFSSDGVLKLSDFFKAFWTELKRDIVFVGQLFMANFGAPLTNLFKRVFGSDFSLSLKGMVEAAAKGVDAIYGFFYASANSLATIFLNVPATFTLIIVKMVNAMITYFQIGVNKLVEILNNNLLNTDLGRKLGVGQLQQVTLKLLAVPPEAASQGDKLAASWAQGFAESHQAQDMVSRLMLSANQAAADRLKAQQGRQDTLNNGANQFNTPGSVDPNRKDLAAQATADIIAKLREQADALEQVSIQRRIDLDLLKIVNQERAKGIQLTGAERQAIANQLQENEVLKLKAKITQEITGAMEDNAIEQKAINQIIADGTDHLSAYVAKLNELKIKQLEMNRDLVSGFKAGFLELQNNISDFAKQGEKVVGDLFNGMSDALVEFVKTGKLNFSSLVDTILADLLKIVINQAFMAILGSLGGAGGMLGSLFGGLASGAAGGVAGARAGGGDVSSGKAYIVGEKGPEIFRPDTGGSIIPNGAMGGANVNLKVVNVTDPNEVAAALGDPANHQVLVNVIRRNKGAVKQALGI